MVIHEAMSLGMMVYQYSKFLFALKDTFHDPFRPEIKLDYFAIYHIRCNANWIDIKLPRQALKDYGD